MVADGLLFSVGKMVRLISVRTTKPTRMDSAIWAENSGLDLKKSIR
nr:unnamed protein product [Callosobruchus analis]